MGKKISCGACRKKLSDYRLGLCGERVAERIRGHLEACADCRAELERLESIERALQSVKPAPLPPDFETVLHEKFAEESAKDVPRGIFSERMRGTRRALVPVLTAFVLVAVFSTGIYDRMLNQNQSVESEIKITSQSGATYEYGEDFSTPAPSENAAGGSFYAEATSSDTAGEQIEEAVPSAASVAGLSESAPEREASANDAVLSHADTFDGVDGESGESSELPAIAAESADSGDAEANGITEDEENTRTRSAARAYSSEENDAAEESTDIVYAGESAVTSDFASGSASSSSSASSGSSGNSSRARGIAAQAVYTVYIKTENPEVLLEKLGLTDSASEGGGEYTVYLSLEEYENLLDALPDGSEVSEEEYGDFASVYPSFCVIITQK